MSAFEIGDVVRLTCSSTKMTVDKVGVDQPDGDVECVWFNADDELQSARFHARQLILVKRPNAND